MADESRVNNEKTIKDEAEKETKKFIIFTVVQIAIGILAMLMIPYFFD